MGKSKTTQKTVQDQTQTAAPPSWTAPGLIDAASMVTQGLQQIPTTHYSGPMVATMDPAALQNIMSAWNATAANAGGLAATMQGRVGDLANPYAYQTQLPDTSYSLAPRQELDNVIAASIDPVRRQLMEQILPSMTSSALASGAYSGDRAMSVLPGQALQQFGETAGDIAARLGYEDYQNYENRRLQAYGMQTQAAQGNYALEDARHELDLRQLSMLPDYVNAILHTQGAQGDLLSMAAQLEQAQRQAAIQDAVGRDQYASQAPFMGLDTASQLLAMLSGRYGTTDMHGNSTTTTTQSQPIGMQLLQGALGVGSMIAGMPGGLGALGIGGGAAAAASPAAGAASLFKFDPNRPFG